MAQWHAKATGAYSINSSEAKDNAEMFYGTMYSLGWCLEAVCAALGNQSGESGYNPWRWGDDDVLPDNSPWIDERQPKPGGGTYNHAYGLFQQDPAGKYLHRPYAMSLPNYAPNYSNVVGRPEDGDAQCRYLHWICSDTSATEWLPNYDSYSMPFIDFYRNSQNKEVDYLVRTFFGSYERGSWSTVRITHALFWYDYLGGVTPPTPPTPTPTGRKLPLIFYLKRRPF